MTQYALLYMDTAIAYVYSTPLPIPVLSLDLLPARAVILLSSLILSVMKAQISIAGHVFETWKPVRLDASSSKSRLAFLSFPFW